MRPLDELPAGLEGLRESYRVFGEIEVGAASPAYREWSLGIAGDDAALGRIARLPVAKRQPNLVLAAARWHGAQPGSPYAEGLRPLLTSSWPAIRETVLTRSTQTNEPGRCATLLAAFAALGSAAPLALIEVGAAAGLCLLPDRYRYAFDTPGGPVRLGGAAIELPCTVTGASPTLTVPRVAWRLGLDRHPIDLDDADAVAWLRTLVWPGQDARLARFDRAVALARDDKPVVVQGDLSGPGVGRVLGRLLERVPDGLTAVVFRSAVLAYLDASARAAFQLAMTGLVEHGRCHWVSNEGPRVLPAVVSYDPGRSRLPAPFALAVDGRQVAWTHGHGQAVEWLGGPGTVRT